MFIQSTNISVQPHDTMPYIDLELVNKDLLCMFIYYQIVLL